MLISKLDTKVNQYHHYSLFWLSTTLPPIGGIAENNYNAICINDNTHILK